MAWLGLVCSRLQSLVKCIVSAPGRQALRSVRFQQACVDRAGHNFLEGLSMFSSICNTIASMLSHGASRYRPCSCQASRMPQAQMTTDRAGSGLGGLLAQKARVTSDKYASYHSRLKGGFYVLKTGS